MRYRVNEYTIEIEDNYVWLTFQVPAGVSLENSDNEIEIFIKEAIRLIVDESASIIFCSSMQKDLYLEQASFNDSTHKIELAFSIPEDKTVTNTDEFTIEMDWGEAIGDIAKTLSDKIDAIEIPNDYATETSLTSYINKYNLDIFSIKEKFPADNKKMASEDWMSEKFQQIFGDDTTIKEGITGLSAVAATKTDLNSVKNSILGNGSNISLTSLNSALSTATNKIDTIDGKVATSSALSTGLTGINNNLNSVQSVLSGKIEDIEFPTDYAKAAALAQGFSEAAKQSTVGSILGAVAQVNQQGVITSSVIDVATNAKTAADDAKTAANSASSSASNALSAANDAKTASVAAKTAAESVSSAVIKNNKNVIDEILDSAHGLTAIQGLAASASSSSGIASGAAVNAANNTIDIKSELSNSTYGLSAVKTAINAIPTTAPATPANITNAKVEIIDNINNLKSLLPEAVSMGINEAILKTLRVTSQEWELLLHGEPVRIDGDFVKNFSESYPYVICRDDREPRYRFIIKIEQQ